MSDNEHTALAPYDAYAVAEAGHRLYQRGRTRDAQTLFEGLAMANPYDAYFQSMLGAVFHAGGDDTSAFSHYDRALELNPEGLYARVNRAQLHLKGGSPENAVNDLEDAIRRSQTRALSESEQRRIRQAQVLLRGTSQTLKVLLKSSDNR